MEKLDFKGQSSLEVLLLIAGAIIIATVIGLYLKSIPKNVGNEINQWATKIS